MNTELLEIQPHELKFTFEVKKQSSCSIQLTNKTDQYVAFKVKTTSPKKYCVRPTIGVIKPKGTCEFTVTMQAQKLAPPDFLCKDKFLVQSTAVPFGATEEDITSDMFSKDSGRYVDDKKLRVVLLRPPESTILLPNNGELKKDSNSDGLLLKNIASKGIENVPPPCRLDEDVSSIKYANNTDDLKEAKLAVQKPEGDKGEIKLVDDKVEAKLARELEELKSKLREMEAKLQKADNTISKLNDERGVISKEKDMLTQEIEMLHREPDVQITRAGFPLLFVVMVAVISLAFGYFIHPSEIKDL